MLVWGVFMLYLSYRMMINLIFSKEIVIKELMWEYDYTHKKAELIYEFYEKQEKLLELSELIKVKQSKILL